jgi:phage gp36-like protein
MPTPNSSATSYADVDDLVARYDVRSLCQLASDTGTSVSPTQLLTNTRVLECLLDASGMVEAAVMTGGQVSVEALQLLAASDTAGARYLKRLVCNLTLGLLFLARPDRTGEVPAAYVSAEEDLQKIRSGDLVLSLQEQQEAGGAVKLVPEDAADVEDRRGVTVEAQRYFGRRNNRLGPP